MPQPLTVVEASPSDIATIVALSGRIWRAHYPPIIGAAQTEHMLARMYDPLLLLREMTELGVSWRLATVAGAPVGFLSWLHEPATASVKLCKLYLDPAQHGRGLGSAMLAYVESAGRALDARRLYLFVHKRNAKALRAYERNGFAIEASVVSDFDGFVLDDWRLAKALEPR